METKRIDCDTEIKADGEKRTVDGYASTFGNLDRDGDIVLPGAFAKSIEDRFPAGKIKVLWQHRDPIGKPIAMAEDAKGLITSAKLSKTSLGDDALELAKDGIVDRLSIGYTVIRKEILIPGIDVATTIAALIGKSDSGTNADTMLRMAEVAAKIQDMNRPVRLLKQLELHEYSLVTFPANEEAIVTGVKGAADFRAELIRKGADQATIDAWDAFLKSAGVPHGCRCQEGKAGKVLSEKNLNRLQSASALISEVIAAQQSDTPPADPAKAAELRDLLKGAVSMFDDLINVVR